MGATLVLVLIALSFWLLYRFYQVVFILFFTIVMGTVIRPIVNWLHRRGLPRLAGVIVEAASLAGWQRVPTGAGEAPATAR
jgi:predicted PurR-regulated permease PerM